MSTEQHAAPSASAAAPPAAPTRGLRIWPAVLMVASYWVVVTVMGRTDREIYVIFLSSMAASALLLLAFSGWWMTRGAVSMRERLVGLAALWGGMIIAGLASDPSVGVIGLVFVGVPIVLTVWLAWLAFARNRGADFRRWGSVAVLVFVWASFTFARVEGVDGQNHAELSWRWSPSKEDAYAAELAKMAPAKTDVAKDEAATTDAGDAPAQTVTLQEGDWPDFRGPDRLGEVHGVRIATNWNDSPPKELWRRPIGPAWSSVLIVDNRLFTQEQRGELETVVCLDPATGQEIWNHGDQARFSDGQAGAGPRATPVFADGKIYSLGASGVLDCLDAATGKLHWTRNIVTDSGAPLPMWGFSSSPLVIEDKVVVYAGGPNDKGLLAYRASDGEPAWTVATGPASYSSAQRVVLEGKPQILFLSDTGLVAVDPGTGAVQWKHDAAATGTWRVVQPRQVSDASFLIGSEDLGLVRLDVSGPNPSDGSQRWTPTPRYTSRGIRPAYNDFVLHDGFIYGFDESIFCCVELETGKRRWKAGRYGHGQVLLVADQPALVVLSESGEAVAVAANPLKHEELGRFQAVEGKTWNHPVIAHGRLFTRNGEEMACFELKPAE